MSTRSPDQAVISVSLPQALLKDISRRAKALGLARSTYLSLLAQQDLTKTGPLPVPGSETPEAPQTPEPQKSLDLTTEAYDFLLNAIPVLQEYEAAREKGGEKQDALSTVEIPPDIAETKLWRFFLLEMDEILRHKFLRSTELGHDIGLSRAVQEWLQNHHALWAAAHQPED